MGSLNLTISSERVPPGALAYELSQALEHFIKWKLWNTLVPPEIFFSLKDLPINAFRCVQGGGERSRKLEGNSQLSDRLPTLSGIFL